MLILNVVSLLSFLLTLALGETVTRGMPGENVPTPTSSPTWKDYSPQWCTKYGRKMLSTEMPLAESCKKLCIKLNPECRAVEWWERHGGLCFECTNLSKRRIYSDPTDLANPPHVYVREYEKSSALDNCKPNPCMNDAECNSSRKGYECTCPPGYTGTNCEKDINECAKLNGGCSHKCKNTEGSFACSCPDPELNLAPDRRTCVASDVSVKCRKNDMSITLPKTLLPGLNREHVTLRNVNCVATETSTHYTLKTALTGCDTTARHRKGAVVYCNTVLEIPVKDDAIITRVREIEIPFSCYYKNSGDATAVGVKPDTRKLVFDEEGKGNFTVALDMFSDDKFTTAYTQSDFPVQVKLRQNLYFQATVISQDKRLSVLAENCYATPSQDRQRADKYVLLKDGCPVDETTSVIPSSQVGISRFTTEGFKFIADHPFVFVHCHIRICAAGNSNSRCSQGCIKETRKRRDVSSEDKLYPLAQGPLTIDTDVNDINTNHKTIQGVTLPAVLSLAVLSAISIVGMIWLSRKKASTTIVNDVMIREPDLSK